MMEDGSTLPQSPTGESSLLEVIEDDDHVEISTSTIDSKEGKDIQNLPLQETAVDNSLHPSCDRMDSHVTLNEMMETEMLDYGSPLVEEEHDDGHADNDGGDDDTKEKRVEREARIRMIRMTIGLALLVFIMFVISDAVTNKYIRTSMQEFLVWVEEHPGEGIMAFIFVVFGTTMLFIPGIILTFGSGYVFSNAFGLGVGVLMGVITVFVGASCGAVVSFFLGRFLLRDCVVGLTKKSKTFQALDKAMETKGLRIMLLLRFSPIIFASPYLNYGAGGTAVTLWAYTISLLAMLPASAIFVFLGASARSLTNDSEGSDGHGDSKAMKITLVVGIIFSVIAIVVTSLYVRNELKKISEDSEGDSSNTTTPIVIDCNENSTKQRNENDTNNDEDIETGTSPNDPTPPSNQ